MDVKSVSSGAVVLGNSIQAANGIGVTTVTLINAFDTATSTTSSISGTTLTIGGTTAGYFGLGSTLTGAGLTAGTTITGVKTNTSTGSSILGTTLTIGTLTAGYFGAGQIITGTGITAGTAVISQLTGVPGGPGTYAVSISQTAPASGTEAISSTSSIVTNSSTNSSISGTTLTIGGTVTGYFGVGQMISGTGVTAGTTITALGTGTGGAGTYTVNIPQTAGASIIKVAASASTTMTVTSISSGGILGVGDTISGPGVAPGTVITSVANNSSQTCSISGNTLTVVGPVTGCFGVGQYLVGTGVANGTMITGLGTGTGGPGTYTVNFSQTMPTFSGTEYMYSFSTGGIGNYAVSQNLAVAANATITAFQPINSNSGGGVGTYTVNNSQTVPASGSEPMNTTNTGGTGVYIVSLPITQPNNAGIWVHGGAPIAISTVAGGTGIYTVSPSQSASSTNVYVGAYPSCVAPVLGICPAGWHIPSHTEWAAMERSINGAADFSITGSINNGGGGPGYTLHVTATSGTIIVGQVVQINGIDVGRISVQTSGTTGSTGTYTLFAWQNLLVASTTMTVSAFPSNEDDAITTTNLGTTEGGQLKETGTTHWTTPNTGATNSTGFTGLPGGTSNSGAFYNVAKSGYWYTSSSGSIAPIYRELDYNLSTIFRDNGISTNGMSLRCVKN